MNISMVHKVQLMAVQQHFASHCLAAALPELRCRYDVLSEAAASAAAIATAMIHDKLTLAAAIFLMVNAEFSKMRLLAGAMGAPAGAQREFLFNSAFTIT